MGNPLWFEKWEWPAWKSDATVRRLPLPSRCLWFELLGDLFIERAHTWSGTPEDLAAQLSCTVDQAEAFIRDVQAAGTGDVTLCHAPSRSVTITSRRRRRVENAKEKARLRKKRQREREASRSRPGGEVRDHKQLTDPTDLATGATKPAASRANGKDLRAYLWTLGLELLGKKNRALMGRMVKEHGETRVGQVLGEMAARPPADPVAYFVAACKGQGASDAGRAHYAE